ncbi:SDR family oxidoreductase [Mycobacterium pyrenivorans]|nr:SDR family oxidoreductase [Mycolicibacterium pyrenivorans]
MGGIPLGASGRPSDIAELVVFLVSGRAAYITGAEYTIDGGSSRCT